jgi:hypothetical protein
MSVVGPSRHFAGMRMLVAIRGIADHGPEVPTANSVANDPKPTFHTNAVGPAFSDASHCNTKDRWWRSARVTRDLQVVCLCR